MNLLATIAASTSLKEAKLSRCKKSNEIRLLASVAAKKSPEFHLMAVKISKVPMLFAAGCPDDGPLVLDKNYARVGKLHCSYVPPVIVLSGRKTLEALKSTRNVICSAWVGSDAIKPLKLMASDALSNSELEQQLSALIRDTYNKPKANGASNDPYGDTATYLRDVYPTAKHCIFQQGKQLFRQNFNVNNVTHKVTLEGTKSPVVHMYKEVQSAAVVVGPPNNGPTMNSYTVDMTNFGAPSSELNNPQLRLMLNVEEAIEQYLAMIQNGMHKPVGKAGLVTPPSYVNAATETRIVLQDYTKKGYPVPDKFSTMDFLLWQDKRMKMKASEQLKVIGDDLLTADDFAYVGDTHDISTWLLPVASPSYVQASIANFARVYVPKEARKDVAQRLEAAAIEHNVKLKLQSTPKKKLSRAKQLI